MAAFSQPTEGPPVPTDESTSPERPRSGSVTRFDRWLIRRLMRIVGDLPVNVALWDREIVVRCRDVPLARITIGDRATLFKLLYDPFLHFGEGYSSGRIEIEGDLVELCRAVELLRSPGTHSPLVRRHIRRRNTISRSRRNVHDHYDLGNDFYKLWLDRRLLYTCAYFDRTDASLEDAQIAKMDHVCRKVQLRPGQTVVEAGCGWGALSLHMARHYRVRVKAYNISREQVLYARQCARDEGLEEMVEFIEDDWRNITGRYDAFVSVGMLEHVGMKNYRELGEVMLRSLDENGLGLIHTIGRNAPSPLDRWTEKRIFPGAYPPSLRELMEIFEYREFSVLDVENLRLHYAETLRHWLERFESHTDRVREMFDERFVRTWKLYLSGSIAAFATGGLQLFQITFTHPRNNQIPWTRRHLYEETEPDLRSVAIDGFELQKRPEFSGDGRSATPSNAPQEHRK